MRFDNRYNGQSKNHDRSLAIKEIDEAIRAATEALNNLDAAADALGGARNWGLVDMLGGGTLTTFLKRERMHEAQKKIEAAKRSMNKLSRELRDVDTYVDIDIEMGDFLGFADYFFDGFLADWMVQSKIGKAREQVRRAQEQVWDIRNALYQMREKM
jgi:hypothetical protein